MQRIPTTSGYDEAYWRGIDWSQTLKRIGEAHGMNLRRVWLIKKRLGVVRPGPGGHDEAYWRSIDWSQTFKKIGESHGISSQRVRKLKVKLGLARPFLRGHDEAYWRALDWSQGLQKIADIHRISIWKALQIRRDLHIPPPRRLRACGHDETYWRSLDWSQPIRQIAVAHGVSRQRISQICKALGIVRTSLSTVSVEPAWVKEADWSKSAVDICKKFNLSNWHVHYWAKKLGKKLRRPIRPKKPLADLRWAGHGVDYWKKYPWKQFSNIETARVHGVTLAIIVRVKKKLGLSRRRRKRR